MEGIRNRTLTDLSKQIWKYLLTHNNHGYCGVLLSTLKEEIVVENENGAVFEKDGFSIVRALDCDRMIQQNDLRCNQCNTVRKSLLQSRRRTSNKSDDRTSTRSRVGFKYLPQQESLRRVENLRKEKKQLLQRNKRLEASIEKLIKTEVVNVLIP